VASSAELAPPSAEKALQGRRAAATVAALWGWLRPTPTPTVNRFSLFLPPKQALQPVTQSGNQVAISPDAKRLGVGAV